MSALQSHAAFWILTLVEVLGLASAWFARLSEGSPRQALCQRLFFGCLVLVGVAMIPALKLGPGFWFSSGTTLSLMILAVTYDANSCPAGEERLGRLLIRTLAHCRIEGPPLPLWRRIWDEGAGRGRSFPRVRVFSIASHHHPSLIGMVDVGRCVLGLPAKRAKYGLLALGFPGHFLHRVRPTSPVCQTASRNDREDPQNRKKASFRHNRQPKPIIRQLPDTDVAKGGNPRYPGRCKSVAASRSPPSGIRPLSTVNPPDLDSQGGKSMRRLLTSIVVLAATFCAGRGAGGEPRP